MRKIRFLIIGTKSAQNTIDLIVEIEKNGNHVTVVSFKDFVFENRKGIFSVMLGDENLQDFDIYIFRGCYSNLFKAQLFINRLIEAGKVVIDESLGKFPIYDKVFQSSRFSLCGVPHPNTAQALNFVQWKKIVDSLGFPMIVKPCIGSQGRGVLKFEHQKEALDFFAQNPSGYMAQQYVPIKEDVRVFVVGKKVLGAMRRFIIDGDYRSNASLGAKTEKAQLTDEMEKIALEAATAMQVEIAGVDLIRFEDRWLVLEVNAAPQWQAFKVATGINPAEHITEYAVKKHMQKA